MWFIGVEVEQETSAPRPKRNPGSAPVCNPFLETARFAIPKLSFLARSLVPCSENKRKRLLRRLVKFLYEKLTHI